MRREFLSLDTDPRSPERGQYGFVQGLIAEVAYAMLSRRDRSAKHLAPARHYESLEDDELTALVASHYVEAYRAAPEGPEAEIAAKRPGLARRAGQRALSLGSPEQALAFSSRPCDMTTSGAERAALLELAGDAAESRSATIGRSLSPRRPSPTTRQPAIRMQSVVPRVCWPTSSDGPDSLLR